MEFTFGELLRKFFRKKFNFFNEIGPDENLKSKSDLKDINLAK